MATKTDNWTRYNGLSDHDLYDLGQKEMESKGYIDPEIYWEMDERAQAGSTSAEYYRDQFNTAYKETHNGKPNPNWSDGGNYTGTPTPDEAGGKGTPFAAHPAATGTPTSINTQPVGGASDTATPTPGAIGGNKTAIPGSTAAAGPPYRVGTEVGHDRPDPPLAYAPGMAVPYGPPAPFDAGNQSLPILGRMNARQGEPAPGPGSPAGGPGQPWQPYNGMPDQPNYQSLNAGQQVTGAQPAGDVTNAQVEDNINNMLYGANSFTTTHHLGETSVGAGAVFDPNSPEGQYNLATAYHKDAGDPRWMAGQDTPYLQSLGTLMAFDDPAYGDMTNAERVNTMPGIMDNLNSNQFVNAGHYYDQIVNGDYSSNMVKTPGGMEATADPKAQAEILMGGIDALSPYYDPQSLAMLKAQVGTTVQDWQIGVSTDPEFRAQYPNLTDYLRAMGAENWM